MYKLDKALYGIKQAPLAWAECLADWLISIGLDQSAEDPCIFYDRTPDGRTVTIIAVYVDDLVICSETQEWIEHFNKALGKKFNISENGEIKYVLGIKVDYNREARTLELTQETFIEDLLCECGMTDAKPVLTPLPPETIIDRADGVKLEDQNTAEFRQRRDIYRSIVGSGQWLEHGTRPDISLCMSMLGRVGDCPSEKHMTLAKHFLRYLRGTSKMGLLFDGGDPSEAINLEVFADAAFNNDANGHSQYGFCIGIEGCGFFAWASRKISSVVKSSTEAELMSASEAHYELIYYRRLLAEFEGPLQPSILYQDNQSTIAIIKGTTPAKQRTKHIESRYFKIREGLYDSFYLEWMPTQYMIADIFTKALNKDKLHQHASDVNGMSPVARKNE